jgi:hypothetical protein
VTAQPVSGYNPIEPLPRFRHPGAWAVDRPAVGAVLLSEILLRYARLRPAVSAAHMAAFDTAVAAIRDLPVDEHGALDLPIGPEPPPSTVVPPPSSSFPQELRQRAVECLRAGISAGALSRIRVPLAWHRAFAIVRSDAVRIRLIADLRPVNARLPPPPPFSLTSHLGVVGFRASCAMKTDLSDAFWSIRVSARMAAHMAMRYDGADLAWRVLPFGLSWSPYCFHTVLEPVIPLLQSVGAGILKYLDDFLVSSSLPEHCAAASSYLHEILRFLRFRVSAAKSSRVPATVLEFLGMEVDFTERVFRWPRDKAKKVSTFASEALAAGYVGHGQLAQFLGRLAFLTMCCPLLSVARRSLDALLHSGPSGRLRLTAACRVDLQFWLEESPSLQVRSYPFADLSAEAHYVLASDASDRAGGITVWTSASRVDFSVRLPDSFLPESSGARELWVTLTGLDYIASFATPGSVVDVYTDSRVSVGAMAGHARAASMVRLARSLLLGQRASQLVIRPAWLPRDLVAFQDALSRSSPFAECSLVSSIMSDILQWAWQGQDATVDVFASPSNAVCPRFVTIIPDADAIGADGLRFVPIATDRVFCFPPFALAARAASHYASTPGSTVWVGPARLNIHRSRPHCRLSGQVLCVPPFGSLASSLIDLVVVLLP